jgi:hypothetical protein
VPRVRTVSADYITQGDGTDANPYNASAIQNALTDAGNYGTVYVQKGTYSALTNIVQKGVYQHLICEAGVKIKAATGYAIQPNTNGMICLAYDGTNTYDGFILDGNGLVIDGSNQSVQLLDITTAGTKARDFVLRDFTVQNAQNLGIIVGNPVVTQTITTRVENALVEHFNAFNCRWLLVIQSEFVTVRHGRCRTLPDALSNGLFVTAQAPGSTFPHLTRYVIVEDVDCNSNTGDVGGVTGDSVVEVQAGADPVEPATTYGVLFRNCRIRSNPGATSPNGGIFIDDNFSGASGPGLLESVTFEHCEFDGPKVKRTIANASTGYAVFDHCRFLNSAGFTPDTFAGGGNPLTRPIILRRHVGSPTGLPNQNVAITVGPSPFTFANVYQCKLLVVVQGGNVSAIRISIRGGTSVLTGLTTGTFHLNEGDSLQVTYASAPTMTGIPFDR